MLNWKSFARPKPERSCFQTMRSYIIEYNKWRYEARRLALVNLLGGRCVKCNSVEKLEFDHIDPNTKTYAICKIVNYRDETVLSELEKCQLLCNSCHNIKSSLEASLVKETNHNKLKFGSKDCRCGICKKKRREYMRELRSRPGYVRLS